MMVKSRFPDLNLPQTDILSYLFPPGEATDDTPIWMDAEEPSRSISASTLEAWVRRLGHGLQQSGIDVGDVVLVCSPNHVIVPVAYLGIIGYGAIFTGLNPTYSVQGA